MTLYLLLRIYAVFRLTFWSYKNKIDPSPLKLSSQIITNQDTAHLFKRPRLPTSLTSMDLCLNCRGCRPAGSVGACVAWPIHVDIVGGAEFQLSWTWSGGQQQLHIDAKRYLLYSCRSSCCEFSASPQPISVKRRAQHSGAVSCLHPCHLFRIP